MPAQAIPRPADEHAWHACALPLPPTDPTTRWHCPHCHQTWIWRRPPRPTAQWIRLDTTTGDA